eukprot:CAMPEP_0177462656 /NCGR_PEP_ID=MMETSP0369-20130122/15880_1 /TAXON_ID=447022 ORGANISM="Scrippsiella hangoei-like, Strain SHHI-4" /NCGR_SAMPLE_ID=MMETSP0369 /ASSEMBLY_ACC=CAM_ASM_000364 /LENGTH=122 /DNA_ID=CAMNT_0018936255 /DNA_START=273 /DNA_END=638 /DNA_ORIENTATION=+
MAASAEAGDATTTNANPVACATSAARTARQLWTDPAADGAVWHAPQGPLALAIAGVVAIVAVRHRTNRSLRISRPGVVAIGRINNILAPADRALGRGGGRHLEGRAQRGDASALVVVDVVVV